jgi:hypothetical protein
MLLLEKYKDEIEFIDLNQHQSYTAYCCPTCGFDTIYVMPEEVGDEEFEKRGGFIIYTKDENGRISGYRYCYILVKGKDGKIRSYPKVKNYSNRYFGGADWTELHFCPFCKKEFSFSNGD